MSDIIITVGTCCTALTAGVTKVIVQRWGEVTGIIGYSEVLIWLISLSSRMELAPIKENFLGRKERERGGGREKEKEREREREREKERDLAPCSPTESPPSSRKGIKMPRILAHQVRT